MLSSETIAFKLKKRKLGLRKIIDSINLQNKKELTSKKKHNNMGTCCSGGPGGQNTGEVDLNLHKPATPAEKIFDESDGN